MVKVQGSTVTSAAERVARSRRARAEHVQEVTAAHAIGRALQRGEDAAADAMAAVMVKHAEQGHSLSSLSVMSECVQAAARERDGRASNAKQAAERDELRQREANGYVVPMESTAESTARLIGQRYGRGAALMTADALALEFPDGLTFTAALALKQQRVALGMRADYLIVREREPWALMENGRNTAEFPTLAPMAHHVSECEQAAAVAAALLSDRQVARAEHDPATCTLPTCYRCTAATNANGKRARVAPVRAIGTVGSLATERPKVKRGSRYRVVRDDRVRPSETITHVVTRGRTTTRQEAIHLVRESSLVRMLDIAAKHDAHGTPSGESELPTEWYGSHVVAAAVLSLVSAHGDNYERPAMQEWLSGHARIVAECESAAAVEIARATEQRESARYAEYWLGHESSWFGEHACRASVAGVAAAARAEHAQASAAAATHERRARQLMRASTAARAEQEHSHHVAPLMATSVGVAMAVHHVAPPSKQAAERRAAVLARSPLLAQYVRAMEQAFVKQESAARGAYRVHAEHVESMRVEQAWRVERAAAVREREQAAAVRLARVAEQVRSAERAAAVARRARTEYASAAAEHERAAEWQRITRGCVRASAVASEYGRTAEWRAKHVHLDGRTRGTWCAVQAAALASMSERRARALMQAAAERVQAAERVFVVLAERVRTLSAVWESIA